MAIKKEVGFFSKCKFGVYTFFCVRALSVIFMEHENLALAVMDLHLLWSSRLYSRFQVQIIF